MVQMRSRLVGVTMAACAAAALIAVAVIPISGQAPAAYKAPRTKDGKPNLNGIWQANNEANWNIAPHAASQGPVLALGAAYSVPPGLGVVDGELPYTPQAAAKQKENFANRMKLDPEIKCYMAGVPRANYMPYPFQIIQGNKDIMIVYEYAGAVRTINMGAAPKAPADFWMGWSNGKWEGETLVVDVTGMNDLTWFDRAGNFHSDALHVTERYTATSPDALLYEATIEDPKTFTKPWKMSMPIYRRLEKNAQIIEYKCVEFAEEVLYGHLRKQPIQGKGDSK
jgi:hypothetical protein